MTKSNFQKIAQLPLFDKSTAVDEAAAPAAEERPAKSSLFARPPRGEHAAEAPVSYGAIRAGDGRTARRTGRTVQFATVVSEEFKRWLKMQAAARGKSMAALLDDMRAAYIDRFGE
jgi:hypothetical protein